MTLIVVVPSGAKNIVWLMSVRQLPPFAALQSGAKDHDVGVEQYPPPGERVFCTHFARGRGMVLFGHDGPYPGSVPFNVGSVVLANMSLQQSDAAVVLFA